MYVCRHSSSAVRIFQPRLRLENWILRGLVQVRLVWSCDALEPIITLIYCRHSVRRKLITEDRLVISHQENSGLQRSLQILDLAGQQPALQQFHSDRYFVLMVNQGSTSLYSFTAQYIVYDNQSIYIFLSVFILLIKFCINV